MNNETKETSEEVLIKEQAEYHIKKAMQELRRLKRSTPNIINSLSVVRYRLAETLEELRSIKV